MPDKTEHYFQPYVNLQIAIHEARKRGDYKEKFNNENEDKLLIDKAIHCMIEAFAIHEYTLTIEHICKVLNLEERHAKNTILPCLDYILAPTHAGQYFTSDACMDMPFWERRMLKWKKLFINKDSFKKFIQDHVTMTIVHIQEKEEKQDMTPIPISESLADALINKKVNAYRRCNLKDIILKQKLYRFQDKTIKDIRYWQGKQSFSEKPAAAIRAEQEIKLLSKLRPQDLDLKVHDKEIADFLDAIRHISLTLDIGDKKPIKLYIVDTNSVNKYSDI